MYRAPTTRCVYYEVQHETVDGKKWGRKRRASSAHIFFFDISFVSAKRSWKRNFCIIFFLLSMLSSSPQHISSLRHIFSRSHVDSPYILMCATVDYLVYNTTATATATKFISSFLHATISSLKEMHMGCAVWWDQITYINLFSWSYIPSSISVTSCFSQEKKNDAVMKSQDKTWVWLAPTIRRESWHYIVITTWTLIKLEDVRLLFWSRCRERLSELLHVLHITLRGSERHMVPIRNISSFWVSHGTRQFYDFQLIRSFRFHFQFTSSPLLPNKAREHD